MATLLGRYISVFVFGVSVIWAMPSSSKQIFSDRYDEDIQSAAKHYLPGIPWKLLKAQLFQESRLDPDARSGVGASGIGQFMPATWADVTRELGYGNVSPAQAKYAIPAAAYYMAQLRGDWQRNDLDRHRFALGSYNAGGGNIRRAVRACNATTWEQTIVCLPDITGEAFSQQTTDYVTRIWKWFAMMELGA